MRHKFIWFRSCQVNRPCRVHPRVKMRHKSRSATPRNLRRLLQSLRKVPKRRQHDTTDSNEARPPTEPISLSQQLLLRRHRRLPVRDLILLHKLYRAAQSSAGELFDIVTDDLGPTSRRSLLLRFAIRHRFQK